MKAAFLALFMPLGALAQTCYSNDVTCTAGSVVAWDNCATASLGGSSVAASASSGDMTLGGVSVFAKWHAYCTTSTVGPGPIALWSVQSSWGPFEWASDAFDTLLVTEAGTYQLTALVGRATSPPDGFSVWSIEQNGTELARSQGAATSTIVTWFEVTTPPAALQIVALEGQDWCNLQSGAGVQIDYNCEWSVERLL